MSVIAGIYDAEGGFPSKRLVNSMLGRQNRLEDGEIFSIGSATLGQARGRQANAAQSNGVICVMDGFIYDGPGLSGQGPDALWILELYLKNGFTESLSLINGDFAVALFDTREDTLWLARDRFGIKPLYYSFKKRIFTLASRPGALLKAPGVSAEIDRRFAAVFACSHYRYFDNLPERSPFKDVFQLPAGHYLRFKNGEIKTERYWRLEEQPDLNSPEDELAEQYRDLLLDSVKIRLQKAKAPVFTLSGGMDSSSVLSSAVSLTGDRRPAISTVYDDKTYDESGEIESMLETKVSKWHQSEVGDPDVFELVKQMVDINEEPVATATWLSHFLLCRQAADLGYESLFGGLGGDELNAGEYEYFFFHFADLRLKGENETLSEEVKLWIKYHDHPIFKKNAGLVEEMFSRVVDLSRPGICLPESKRLFGYGRALNPYFFNMDDYTPVMVHPFTSYLKNRTFQDIFYETAPCCLRAEDRQTAAFGLDNFLPFFDHRLAEFMFRIPGHMKIRRGVTKHLLRSAMKGLLPEDTRTRIKKTGWNAPAHVWFAGPGREPLMDMIKSTRFRNRGIYIIEKVEDIIAEHCEIVASGAVKENHMMFLWQLVNLELWFDWLEQKGYS